MRRLIRALLAFSVLFVVLVIAAGWWARGRLQASLPQLDGERLVNGLRAPVDIARDSLGIPTIRGANRVDVARATGFVHAQDRFFQMDLARRRAAGELAELVGPRAIALDREIRIHRFRAIARRAVDLLSSADRELLDAYATGANAGLTSLGAKPFEYFILRHDPQPWRSEDSLLVVLSMFITLQDTDGSFEATLATMHDVLPREMYEFFAPRGTEWDTPVVGEAFPTPPVPAPSIYDARQRRNGKPPLSIPKRPEVARKPRLGFGNWELGVDTAEDEAEAAALGSNNFAVAARLTAGEGALVANDMHLNIRVPNTWYRAAFEWPDHRLVGVTLPGVPALVVGSNTHVAWGFTNTYGDWSDIVLVEPDPASRDRYLTPGGPKPFERFTETLRVKGQAPQDMTVTWTIWGPLLGPDHRGRLRAYRWVAHSAEQLAASITPMESARTIEDAFDAANGLGTPGQNFVVADRSGRIGWTVYGSIPRRVGIDGRLPASWADGSRGWQGWLSDAEYPRLVDPPHGRLWTANARVVDGDMLAKLGDGSYEVGSRARIIRDRLMSQERFTTRALLDIQLETRADFLKGWRELILRTLTREAVDDKRERREFLQIVQKEWSGRALPHSAAYRLTRAFRERVSEWVFIFALADCYEADEHFDYTTERKREGPIWKLVTEQPQHLLDPQYPTWNAMFVAAVDSVIADVMKGRSGDLADRRWAEANVTAYRHPLSAAVPFIGRWLDMPERQIPGDLYTPRVAWGSVGASERMIVSPGREASGIMHMPTGQSGHPLSPHYADSHDAWVNGEPTPFLPGRTVHSLTLVP
jgi:penicillin G amidase